MSESGESSSISDSERTSKSRARSKSYTSAEISLLMSLVQNNRDIVESKKTDFLTTNSKKTAWAEICLEFGFEISNISTMADSKDNYVYASVSDDDVMNWAEDFFKARKEKGPKPGEKRECFICQKESVLKCKDCATLHKIDGRRVPFYCGKEHQKIHWKNGHKNACNRFGGAQSLFGLVFDVYKNCLPKIGVPEYNDYGFANCKTITEEKNLLGLYIGLIEVIKCDLDDLHEACMNVRLDKFIVAVFEEKQKDVRFRTGEYYPWFLDNQHVVQNIVPIRNTITHPRPQTE